MRFGRCRNTGGRATSASSGTSSNSWCGCRRGASSGSSTFPSRCAANPALLTPIADRRSRVADDLYDALVKQGASFWEHVYPMFLARDITRHDLRELVRRGLRESRGRYKALLTLFGMSSRDYRRFMNFLAAHECGVGVPRISWRSAAAPVADSEMPPLHSVTARRRKTRGGRIRAFSRTAAECPAAASSSAAWSG